MMQATAAAIGQYEDLCRESVRDSASRQLAELELIARAAGARDTGKRKRSGAELWRTGRVAVGSHCRGRLEILIVTEGDARKIIDVSARDLRDATISNTGRPVAWHEEIKKEETGEKRGGKREGAGRLGKEGKVRSMRFAPRSDAAIALLAAMWQCDETMAAEVALQYLGSMAGNPPRWLLDAPRAVFEMNAPIK